MNIYLIKGKKIKLEFSDLVDEMNGVLWKNVNWFKSHINCAWLDEDDIYQEFLITMWESTKTYDISKGHFSTHLTHQIKSTQNVIMSNLMAQKRDISKTDTRDISDFLYEPKPIFSNILSEEDNMWDRLVLESLDKQFKFSDREIMIIKYLIGEVDFSDLQQYMKSDYRSKVYYHIDKLKNKIREELVVC